MTVRSSLGRHVPSARTDGERMALRRAAYRDHGLVTLRLEEITDAWRREIVRQEAERILTAKHGDTPA